MIWLLRDFDLLSVLLRALTLGLEILTLGGVAYLLAVALPARAGESVAGGCWRGIRWAATSFAIVELCYVAVESAILMGSSSLRFGDVVGAPYFLAGAGAAIAASAIVVCARAGGRRIGVRPGPFSRAGSAGSGFDEPFGLAYWTIGPCSPP